MSGAAWLLLGVAVLCAGAVVVLVGRRDGTDVRHEDVRVAALEREIGTQYVDRYVNLAQELEELRQRVEALEGAAAPAPQRTPLREVTGGGA